MIQPEVASKIKEILIYFQDNTILEAYQDIVTSMVEGQSAITTVKAFVYIVDNMARTQSQILTQATGNEFTVEEVYAALYAAAGHFTGENN